MSVKPFPSCHPYPKSISSSLGPSLSTGRGCKVSPKPSLYPDWIVPGLSACLQSKCASAPKYLPGPPCRLRAYVGTPRVGHSSPEPWTSRSWPEVSKCFWRKELGENLYSVVRLVLLQCFPETKRDSINIPPVRKPVTDSVHKGFSFLIYKNFHSNFSWMFLQFRQVKILIKLQNPLGAAVTISSVKTTLA